MPRPAPTPPPSYPIDDRLMAALEDARERGDALTEATVRLALEIRHHHRFDTLVERMAGVEFPASPRGLARTSKTALLGHPAPGTDLAKALALARVIAVDLVPPAGRADAASLALVLAEECRRPVTGRRLRVEQPAT